MSAACAGFPARIRESSIRLCQAHLGLTVDAAAEAYVAASVLVSAAAAATASVAAQPTSSPSGMIPPASRTAPQRGSEITDEHGSPADLSEEIEARQSTTPQPNECNNRRDSESRTRSGGGGGGNTSSSSTSSGRSAIGAVVRAACLIASQGLMDPNKDVRLAGADLARAALSLWSSIPVADEVGVGDKREAANVDPDATTVQRSNPASEKRSTSDEDSSIAGDHHEIGHAPGRRGSVGSDDGLGSDTLSLSETASDSGSEYTERSQARRAAQSVSTRIVSTLEGQEGSGRSSESGSAAHNATIPNVRAAVPLRDLRWGLELVLACVAPYMTNRAVVSHEERSEGIMRTTGGSATGSVSNNSGRRSTSGVTDRRRKFVSTPAESIAGGDALLDGGLLEAGDGSRDECNNSSETKEELPRPRPADPRLYEKGESGEDGHDDDGDRSLLALRVVDFACRHPGIGPALVSSVLVGWIPCLVHWGRNTLPAASFPGPNKNAKAGRAGAPRSPRCAPFTAGEAAASEALASGAIEMLVYMVENFPLLPLSDFSAENLVAAAEGGMAFAGGTRSTSAGDGHRRRNGAEERRRDGELMGGRGEERPGNRRSQRSLTTGRAKKAGEALMLELFLRTSGNALGGGDAGGDCCLDSLLPALNTARGINFLDKTAATAHARANGTRRRADTVVSNRSKTEVKGEGGQGMTGGLERGRNSCSSPSEHRPSSSTARERGRRAIGWPSQRRPLVPKVEVRQRLALPPTPPAAAPPVDLGPSSSADSNGGSAAPEEGKRNTSALSEDGKKASHVARHGITHGVHPHMSDSSSAERLSTSTGKSAAADVVSEGRRGAAATAAPGGVHGDDDSSSFASLSHGSLSSTSLVYGSEAEGGSSIDSRPTGQKPGEIAAETKKKPAAAARGSAQEGGKPVKDGKSVKQAAEADSAKNSKKVFPVLSFGEGKSNRVEEPARNDVDDKTSVGSTKAATAEDKPATKAGEAKAKKGGGGFMSKLFGRGKK